MPYVGSRQLNDCTYGGRSYKIDLTALKNRITEMRGNREAPVLRFDTEALQWAALDPNEFVYSYHDESDWGSEKEGNFHLTGITFAFGRPTLLDDAVRSIAGATELKGKIIFDAEGIPGLIRVGKELLKSIDQVDYSLGMHIGPMELTPCIVTYELLYEGIRKGR